VSELVEDKASNWRLKITHACESVFVIAKEDIIYKYVDGVDSGSQTYRVKCPACQLDQYIPYSDLPGWVQQWAMANKREASK
jgi:hypothetical protein